MATKKQLRASQFNFAKYLLKGIRAQVETLHRHFKVIDQQAVREMDTAIEDCLHAIEYHMEKEGFNSKGR